MATVTVSKKIRNAVASWNPGYVPTKGAAIAGLDTLLEKHDLRIDYSRFVDLVGDAGKALLEVVPLEAEDGAAAVVIILFSWFRMDSGNYEIVAYCT